TEQMEGAGKRRASDRYHKAGLRLCQSALPRAQKERSSPHCHLRAGQSVYRTPASIALRGGVIYLAWPPAVANVEDVTPITVPPIPNCHCCCNFNGRYPLPAPLFRPSLAQRTRRLVSTKYRCHSFCHLEMSLLGGRARSPSVAQRPTGARLSGACNRTRCSTERARARSARRRSLADWGRC